MVEVRLNLNKSIEQNAEVYFEKSKKAKRKVKGAEEAVEKLKKRVEKLEKLRQKELDKLTRKKLKKEQKFRSKLQRKWFEKFHWFTTSDSLLVIGGKDATSNEIVVKKHTDKDDIVFHTESPGSPFCVIKADSKSDEQKMQDKPIAEFKQSIEETAIFCGCHSNAWKLGLSNTQVFWVNPDQISKTAPSGEYIAKGAFMIKGKRNYANIELRLAIGATEDEVIAGPISAVQNKTDNYIIIKPGNLKKSECAKKIAKLLKVEIDDVFIHMPSGKSAIERTRSVKKEHRRKK